MLWIFFITSCYVRCASPANTRVYDVRPSHYRPVFFADLQSRIFSDKFASRFDSGDVQQRIYRKQRVVALAQSLPVLGIDFGTASYEQAQQEDVNCEAAKIPFSLYKSANEYRYTSSYPSYDCFAVPQGLETVRLSSPHVAVSTYIHPRLVANMKARMISNFEEQHQQQTCLLFALRPYSESPGSQRQETTIPGNSISFPFGVSS